jgi:hypothetical protein
LLVEPRSPDFVSVWVWVCVGAVEFGDDQNSAPIANIAPLIKFRTKPLGSESVFLSASLYLCSENVVVEAIVIPELKFCNVK